MTCCLSLALSHVLSLSVSHNLSEALTPNAGLTNRGLNLLQKKDFENAFLTFDTAVELFPDAGYLHEHMGQAQPQPLHTTP